MGILPKRVAMVPTDADLIDAIRAHEAQILFKRSRVPVSREVVAACPSLHAVQLCCIGSDSVDLQACADHGVMVFNDPVSNGRSVVELAVGHLVALSRRLYETDASTHQGTWEKTNAGRYEIQGKKLGIIGLGNIGRAVARVADALGMEVWFYDNRPVAQEVGQEMGWAYCDDLAKLMAGSDMVTVHISAFDANGNNNANVLDPHLCRLGEDRPSTSPRLFLNLARGNLHGPQALLDAVENGQIRRAAVDVYPDEPGPGEKTWANPYAEQSRIICTPHIGAATQEAQPRIARRVSTTIEAFNQFGTMRDCVYAPRAKMSVRDHAKGRVVLAVTHSVSRGTKKAVDDAIFEAGCNNFGSIHRDFGSGVAYDLSVIDRPLSRDELNRFVERATDLADDEKAIRTIRQICP
jgi:D-3-phosphoglycerate dehydrogenase